MIKFTNEIALITAVSDLRMFLDNVKGFTALFWSINSRSAEEKSPSGPISIQQVLMFLRSSAFKFSFELTSANKIFEFSSKVFKKSFNLITSIISGGASWLDCSVASITIFFALSRFNS